MPSLKEETGLVALIIVIIICTAALIMAFSASLLGLGGLEASYTYQQGSEAQALADGCAEEALYRLKLDSSYDGGNLVLDNGSCIIEVVDPVGPVDRQITVTATTGQYYKKVQLAVSLSGGVDVLSWSDVAL